VPGVLADDFHYENMLVGNRAAGMGGAYTAVSDDPSGCYYNPAGIAFSPHASFSASVNAYVSSTKTYKAALKNINGDSVDWVQKSSGLVPNYFGMVRKLGPGRLGISYGVSDSTQRRQQQTFDNIDIMAGNPVEKYTININDADKTYLGGLSYGYRVSDSFCVGATLYVYYRDRENIWTQLAQFSDGQHYLSNYYETETDIGYKPILGVIWEPFDRLAVGLTASKISIASSEHEEQWILRNTTIAFFDDTNTIYFEQPTDTEKSKFPLATSLGLAYFASPKLLLSGDIKFYQAVPDEKEAVNNLSLGAEFYVRDSLALRFGLFTDKANTPSLSPGEAEQNEHIDINGASLSLTSFQKKSSITIGFSYGLGTGEAQVAGGTAIQDAEITNLTGYICASSSY